ncbi:MAG TPA: PKD-like domain-containing protein, partial [Ferruginibacter sp.]|nr:PKD-like domain-containing protein [Ferruginibacter sp.]
SGSICNNTAQAYTITSSTPGATFNWSRPATAGISTPANSAINSSSITESLNNTTALPVAVVYTITPFTAAGCPGTPFTYTITVNPTPIVNSPSSGFICSGTAQSYSITSSVPGTTFTWTRAVVAGISNAGTTSSGSTISETLNNTGTTPVDVPYVINATSPSDCPGPAFTYTITVNPTPPAPNVRDTTLCQGVGSVSVGGFVTGSYPLLWYTSGTGGAGSSTVPSVNIATLGTTTYYISQITTPAIGSCEGPRARLDVEVDVAANPSVGISVDKDAICEGLTPESGLVTFTAAATNVGSTTPIYQWIVNGVTISNASSSTYSTDSLQLGNNTISCVVIVQSSGCFSAYTATSNTVNVQAYQNPTISLSASPTIIDEGDQSQITATVTPNVPFNWSSSPDIDGPVSNSLNPIVTPSQTTIYTLTVPASGGAGVCPEISDTVSVTVYTKNFYMPSAFSPNGDGKDDVFRVPPPPFVSFNLTDFVIYDRWGLKVFETSDITKGWDGTYHGSPADIATYVYVITGNDLHGKVEHKGTVVLVR